MGTIEKQPHNIKPLTHNQLFLLCFGDSATIFPSLALSSVYNPACFSALASRMMELRVDLAFLWINGWCVWCWTRWEGMGPQEMELEAVVTHLLWCWELNSHPLQHWAISPTPPCWAFFFSDIQFSLHLRIEKKFLHYLPIRVILTTYFLQLFWNINHWFTKKKLTQGLI